MAVKEKLKDEEVEEDSFEDAFDEAVAEDEGNEEEPIEKAAEPEKDETLKEDGVKSEEDEPDAVEEDLEKEPVSAEEDEPTVKEEPEKPAEPNAAELKKELDELGQKHSTLQGMYNSEVKKEKAPKEEPEKPSAEEAKGEEFKPDTSAITDAIGSLESVKAFTDEYGDEGKQALVDVGNIVAEAVMIDMDKRLEDRFSQLTQSIDPLCSAYAKSSEDAQEGLITGAHSDYRTYVDSGELRAWVDAQKGTEGRVYQEIYDDGSAEEIVGLVAAFREAKGYVKAVEPEKKEKEVEPEIDQSKLEDMEAVDTKKSPVSVSKGGVSKDNYDDAWDKA